jgi:hypothetical protein
LPRKVVLYLSLPEFPDRAIPKSLARLFGDRFEIRFQPENLRSYNKLQFALRDFPEMWIATCDDDRLYDANWLARLVRVAAEHPRTVVSTVGRRMIVDGDRFLPYQDWPYDHSAIPSFLLFPVGSWGILYPPGSLHPAIADRNLISELAPLDDDSWFKAMSLMQNVPCRAVGGKYSMPSLKFEHNVRLWDLNQRGPLMDEALQRVFGHFGLTAGALIAKESTLRSPKNV